MNKKTLILLFLIPCIVVLFISFTSSAKTDADKIYSQTQKNGPKVKPLGMLSR